jgi:hypothetical protein
VIPRRALAAAVLAVAVGTTALEARADADAELEKAHDAYVARQYDAAEARLRVLLDPKLGALRDPDKVADARMILGAVLLAEGKKDDAAKTFDELLMEKSDYMPDPFRVDPEAIRAFRDEVDHLRKQLEVIQQAKVKKEQEEKAKELALRQKEALRIKMLEQLAGQETIVEHNSRWWALVPFGVGQFQNRQSSFGWVLLVSESAFAIGSIVGAGASFYNSLQANSAQDAGQSDLALAYHQRAQSWFVAGNTSFGLFAVTAVVGILHAELTFVPEHVTTRKRDIPPPPQLSIAPLVGPTGLGPSVGLGITGRF